MAFEPQASALLSAAENAARHAYVPYSGKKKAVVLLLEDGSLIPGVRIDNASFSLSISALINAFSTAVALRRKDVVAIAFSHAMSLSDRAFIESHACGPFNRETERLLVHTGQTGIPTPGDPVDPFETATEDGPMAMARVISERAFIPESNFPVGCLMELDDGRLVPGVNVEHPEWPFILCAERNALGTIVSYGLSQPSRIYLSCPTDDEATPCGACRQVMVELAPHATVWMDRGKEPVEKTRADDLLPGYFSGEAIRRMI